MSEQLAFQVDAAIVARLGQELVARQETALIELIKNSYDADATKVSIAFVEEGSSRHLEISDDGSGMTRESLLAGFLRLASNDKVREPRSPRYGRRRAGRKGIGRFAAQRLGHRLVVTTAADVADTALRLTVDWDAFQAGRSLSEVNVVVEDAPKLRRGTTLRIEQLRDSWTDGQIRQAWRGVLSLQQPFPSAPVEGRADADPGFQVSITKSGGLFTDETVISDIQREILDHAYAVIDLEVDSRGFAKWRIYDNRFGEDLDWQALSSTPRSTREIEPFAHLRKIWVRAYYFVLAPGLLPNLAAPRIRKFLTDEGGIRVYRNGFRVVPYGDNDDDWLGLDAAYGKRSNLAPFQNKNFFGFVQIDDPTGEEFDERTSREGLLRTAGFEELTALVSSVLITAATRLYSDRGKKPRAGTPRVRQDVDSDAVSPLGEVSEAIRSTRQAAQAFLESKAPADAKRVVEEASAAEQLIVATERIFEDARALLADESAMLRFLATLGMTVTEFSHETGMSFEAFRLDFDAVFSRAETAGPVDEAFERKLERARSILVRLDTLTGYLNSLASARSARSMATQSLSEAVEAFRAGVEEQASSQQVSLETSIPEFDPLFTSPMHPADLASVLLNLYTNAVKALKRSGNERRILVSADRKGRRGQVRLRFQDTGTGIPVENRDRIFDAFFTTSQAPQANASHEEHARGSGLGLWIVAQVVEYVGGIAEVVEPDAGYSTCIQIEIPSAG